jgi:YfiH family protein
VSRVPFVRSTLLLREGGCLHAFPGADPVEGRGGRERLRDAFAVPPDRVGTLSQVHSATVLELAPEDLGHPDGGERRGDGLFTGRRGYGVAVRTADCVPVLLSNPRIPAVAAIHAGWRGLAAGIVGEGVRALSARFGARALDGLVAAVGPCASGCCYEVGEEVAEALRPLAGGGEALRRGAAPGKWTAHLPGIALALLREAGVPRCEATGPCTVCSPRFHSYRRERSAEGRQASFVVIPAGVRAAAPPRKAGG